LKAKTRRGFTLVEVIVVLVILAILATSAIPALTGYIDKTKYARAKAEARELAIAYQTLLSEAYAEGRIQWEKEVAEGYGWLYVDGVKSRKIEYYMLYPPYPNEEVPYDMESKTLLYDQATGFAKELRALTKLPFMVEQDPDNYNRRNIDVLYAPLLNDKCQILRYLYIIPETFEDPPYTTPTADLLFYNCSFNENGNVVGYDPNGGFRTGKWKNGMFYVDP
jgi:prepilin-type N-terminal cleavage/methylation domain-containing protein